jgi:D-arginine dehydrogenase
VVGGGIAGLSLAATLAPECQVQVLERETQPGYHATGRSAAYFSPALGNAVVQQLTAASADFFREPPAGFTDAALLHPRDALHLFPARSHSDAGEAILQAEALLGRGDTADVHELSVAQAQALWPVLRPGYIESAALEQGGGDLDVDALLQGYRRRLLRSGGTLTSGAEVIAVERHPSGWQVSTADRQFRAKVLVNAAGAWSDQLAAMAGVSELGLQPLRRTAMVLPLAASTAAERWPFVVQGTADAPFYVRPDAGALMLSAADEAPSLPCDAQPEEMDIALAIHRLQRASTLRFDRVTRAWAGLRTFAPDRTFVIGFDARVDDFFWCAGQGGYGVQTAPALSNLAARLLLRGLRPGDAGSRDLGGDRNAARALDPGRFALHG